MLSTIFVFSIFAYIIWRSLSEPWFGIVGFYAFICLDPAWNWRWVLPAGFRWQYYIFISTTLGFFLSGFSHKRLSKNSTTAILAGLLLYALLYVSQSSSVAPSFSQTFMGVYWKVQIVFLLLPLLVDNARKLRLLLFTSVISVAYNAYQVNLEYFQIGYCRYARMTTWGSFGLDNNTMSIGLVVPFAISFCGIFAESNLRIRTLMFSITCLLGHELMLLESRGTWLGAMTAMILTIIFFPKGKSNIIVLLTLLTLGSILAGPPVIKEWESIFATEEEQDASAASRYDLWRAGWEITKQHPFIGVGPNAARVLVPGILDIPTDQKALHNLFFDYSTSAGIPAMLMYIVMGVSAWWPCYRNYHKADIDDPLRMVKLSVITGIPAFWVSSCFSSAPLVETSYLLIGAGLCVSNILAGDSTAMGHVASARTISLHHINTTTNESLAS